MDSFTDASSIFVDHSSTLSVTWCWFARRQKREIAISGSGFFEYENQYARKVEILVRTVPRLENYRGSHIWSLSLEQQYEPETRRRRVNVLMIILYSVAIIAVIWLVRKFFRGGRPVTLPVGDQEVLVGCPTYRESDGD
jgi:hypothetical protein